MSRSRGKMAVHYDGDCVRLLFDQPVTVTRLDWRCVKYLAGIYAERALSQRLQQDGGSAQKKN